MDHHMSMAVSTPELRERFVKVAREHHLAISRWFGEMPGPIVYSVEPSKKTEFLLDGLNKLSQPGLYLIVCHTLVKSPEVEVLRDLNANGPRNMADYRQAELDMLCDPRVKQAINDRGIELVGYEQLRAKIVDRMQPPAE
jgi:hypothetical protein